MESSNCKKVFSYKSQNGLYFSPIPQSVCSFDILAGADYGVVSPFGVYTSRVFFRQGTLHPPTFIPPIYFKKGLTIANP